MPTVSGASYSFGHSTVGGASKGTLRHQGAPEGKLRPRAACSLKKVGSRFSRSRESEGVIGSLRSARSSARSV